MAEAAPPPIFWAFDQTALHGIAVDVAQFLDSFIVGPDVEVVVTRLPERAAFGRAGGAGVRCSA